MMQFLQSHSVEVSTALHAICFLGVIFWVEYDRYQDRENDIEEKIIRETQIVQMKRVLDGPMVRANHSLEVANALYTLRNEMQRLGRYHLVDLIDAELQRIRDAYVEDMNYTRVMYTKDAA
jgi:hypothetical protein